MSFLRRSNQSLIQSIRQLTITVSLKVLHFVSRDKVYSVLHRVKRT